MKREALPLRNDDVAALLRELVDEVRALRQDMRAPPDPARALPHAIHHYCGDEHFSSAGLIRRGDDQVRQAIAAIVCSLNPGDFAGRWFVREPEWHSIVGTPAQQYPL